MWMMQSEQGELPLETHELSDTKSDGGNANCWFVSGITHEGIVQESLKYWNMDAAVHVQVEFVLVQIDAVVYLREMSYGISLPIP